MSFLHLEMFKSYKFLIIDSAGADELIVSWSNPIKVDCRKKSRGTQTREYWEALETLKKEMSNLLLFSSVLSNFQFISAFSTVEFHKIFIALFEESQ